MKNAPKCIQILRNIRGANLGNAQSPQYFENEDFVVLDATVPSAFNDFMVDIVGDRAHPLTNKIDEDFYNPDNLDEMMVIVCNRRHQRGQAIRTFEFKDTVLAGRSIADATITSAYPYESTSREGYMALKSRKNDYHKVFA